MDIESLESEEGFNIYGVEKEANWSFVESAGDFNGDGYDDLIIGTHFIEVNGLKDAGQSYLVFGSKDLDATRMDLSDLDGTNGFQINGIVADGWAGRSVSSAGDINHDGFDDVIIGSRDRAYILYGNPNSLQNPVIAGGMGGPGKINLMNHGATPFTLYGSEDIDFRDPNQLISILLPPQMIPDKRINRRRDLWCGREEAVDLSL